MTNETHFFINIHLSFYFPKGSTAVVGLRDIWRDKYSERGLLPLSSSGTQGVPTIAPPCKPTCLWSTADPTFDCDSLLPSKSDRVVFITWSPSGYTPVVIECPDVQSYLCLLITAWKLVKAHGVTRNEPKIHIICYITKVFFYTHKQKINIYHTHRFLSLFLQTVQKKEISAFKKVVLR